jgi:hypothetical protein
MTVASETEAEDEEEICPEGEIEADDPVSFLGEDDGESDRHGHREGKDDNDYGDIDDAGPPHVEAGGLVKTGGRPEMPQPRDEVHKTPINLEWFYYTRRL